MDQVVYDFFNRIHYKGELPVTFNHLPALIVQFARAIPFENSAIMRKEKTVITFRSIIQKIIYEKRGGLCYELNPLLYYMLKELGFNVRLIAGTVTGASVSRTHIAILLW